MGEAQVIRYFTTYWFYEGWENVAKKSSEQEKGNGK